MKRLMSGSLHAVVVALAAGACGTAANDWGSARPHREPAIPNVIDGVVFEAGNWEPHLAAGAEGMSWGNHRAVVVVDSAPGEAVLVTIPWRRHDRDPALKSIVVVDAGSELPVVNVLPLRVEHVSGDIVFQPNAGSGTYHVYYMPWRSTGGYYPRVTYPRLPSAADGEWVRRVRAVDPGTLPRGRTTRIQSVDSFHSFFPMEVIADDSAAAAFLAGAPDGWALVPEHRDRPVRMRWFLPYHWVARGHADVFEGSALQGEAFTFQLAVIAGVDTLDDVRVTFDGFPDALLSAFTCFSCGGLDETGTAFTKRITVPPGGVQPLWIGVQVPESTWPGTYEGTVTVETGSAGRKTVHVRLDVLPQPAVNHGFDEPELLTRLAWLNSTAGSDPDVVLEPFVPVTVDEASLGILGRRVVLGSTGLPEQLLSYFSPDVTHVVETPAPVLAAPLNLEVVVGGVPAAWRSDGYEVRLASRGRAEWSVESRGGGATLRVDGALEYDGMLDYRMVVTAARDLGLDDIRLPVMLVPGAAEYMLGLGYRGGRRPDRVDWQWKVENHQEGVWLGGIHAGLQWVLRDDDYVRPLNTNFYQNQPLRLPGAWVNRGRGGIRITSRSDVVAALNYSGPRRLAAGDSLVFRIRFLLTPFKPVDTGRHFRTRFVHKYVPVDSVKAWGGTVVNVHHATEINPYINYPFYHLERQKAYIDEAHARGIKVKLYDTIRELSYRAYELFALRSLGDEILNDGDGGGHAWLQEHLEDHYHAGWHAWRVDDAAVLDKGTSRWTNYYIEGLAWLAEHQGIDGLYLDDIAFSRETVKRMVAVLTAHRDDVVIDLHSANQFNPRDGYINSAMLYMEHFPFISRLWFGEYFEYDRGPDYWLTEVSGLPFGLMGEMLQGGGHPYRGMLYGMTARLYGDTDPRPVWRLMDEFGIAESRMLGYWLPSTPVTTDHPRVLATTYVRPDGLLIALGSWSDQDETVRLTVRKDALPAIGGMRAVAPAVAGLQDSADVDLSAVRVPANQGLFIRVH